jgi:hypothetical protein
VSIYHYIVTVVSVESIFAMVAQRTKLYDT